MQEWSLGWEKVRGVLRAALVNTITQERLLQVFFHKKCVSNQQTKRVNLTKSLFLTS